MLKPRMNMAIQRLFSRSPRRGLLLSVIILAVVAALGGGVYAALGGANGPVATSDIELQRGLVGYWPMNGNAKDSTPNANDGTVNGATLTTDRKAANNSAYSFNGSNADIRRTSGLNNIPAFNHAQSIAVWFKLNNNTSYQDILALPGGYQFRLNSSGQLQITYWGGSFLLTSPTTVTTGTWHQAVYQFDGTNWNIYLDGILSATNKSTPNAGSATALYFGSYSAGEWLNGSLDDVRVYNRAISAAEVTALYKQYDPAVRAAAGENGLVGWWKMDGNTKDSTPYGNAMTRSGSLILVADRKGAASSAWQFDGASGMQNSTAPIAQMGTQNWTTSAWIKTTTNGVTQKIIDRRSPGYSLYLNATGNAVAAFYDASNNTVVVTSSAVVTDGNWHLLTATFNRTGNLGLNVDGVSMATSSISSYSGVDATSSYNLRFGFDSVNSSSKYTGTLDDVRVYNRALSAAEITTLYGSYNSQVQVSNLQSGLVGAWPFNGNAKDATPYARNGTLVSGPTLTTDRKGRANSAYSFTGSSSNITVSNAGLPTSAITLSAWTNQSTLVDWYDFILSQWSQTGITGWNLYVDSLGRLRFAVSVGATQYNAVCNAGLVTANSWHHLVGTYDGTTIRAYVDGTVCATTASVAGASFSNSGTFRVGETGNGAATHSIDDVRIWNRALSAAEIAALYKNYY